MLRGRKGFRALRELPARKEHPELRVPKARSGRSVPRVTPEHRVFRGRKAQPARAESQVPRGHKVFRVHKGPLGRRERKAQLALRDLPALSTLPGSSSWMMRSMPSVETSTPLSRMRRP